MLAAFSLATASIREAVYEDGEIISLESNAALFRLARLRLLFTFVATLFGGAAIAVKEDVFALGLSERLLFGLAFVSISGVIATYILQGFLTGTMAIDGACARPGQLDFWAIASILIVLAVIFAGVGFFAIVQDLL